MKLFGNSTEGGPKGWQWLAAPFALVWLALNETRKFLHSKCYDRGWSSWPSWFFSIFLSFGAVIWSSHSLGWEQNYPGYMWMPGGIFAGYCTWAYIWPIIHLLVIRTAIKVTDLVWEVIKFFARDVFGVVTNGFVNVVRYLPGSDALWNSFSKRDFFGNVITFLLGASALGGGCYYGWNVWEMVESFIPGYTPALLLAWTPTWVYSVIGATAGAVVTLAIAGTAWQCLDHGKLNGVAVTTGALLGYAFYSTLVGWLGLIGLTGYGVWGGLAVALVLFVGYVFPAINKLFALGWLEKVLEGLRKINQDTYGDDLGDYHKVYAHLANFAATAALTWVAWTTCGALGLALYFTLPIMALVVVTAYLVVHSYLRGPGAPILVGVGLSGYAGYLTYNHYFDAGYPFGIFGAVPTAILAFLVIVGVIYPLVYIGVKWLTTNLGIEKLLAPLDAFYKWVDDSVKVLSERLERVYWDAYKDNTDFRDWFIQVVNIAVAVAIYMSLTVYLGFGSSLLWIGVAGFITYCAYAFFGQFLARPADIGLHFSGIISGLITAGYVGSTVWGVTDSYWITGVTGFFTLALTYAFAFPVVYIALRFCLNLLVASWSTKLLVGLHSFAWNIFDKCIWTPVTVMAGWFKEVLGPLYGALVAVASAFKAIYDNIMRMLRRN